MKIAILSPFYPFRGGLAQLNSRLYTELGKQHEVKAFSFTTLYPNFLFPGKTQFVEEGDSPTIVENERVLSSVNLFSTIKTAKRINNFAPAVLLIPYWMSFFAPAFGLVCRFINKKIKVVSLVHNAISHEKTIIEKPLAKFFFNRCEAFITMSQPVKNDLLTLKKEAKILLQPHPIYDQYADKYDRIEACKKLNIKSEKKTLLFFGFIREYKGLDLLIQAFAKLDNSYQLIIAGECYGSFDKYTALIDNAPLKDNIIVFEQYIHDDMVTTLFSASDVLVLPYRNATQSGVVGVAYQLETPIIATDVGALGDTVRGSNTGLVVGKPNIENIRKGIEDYFSKDNTPIYRENLKKEKARLSWASFTQCIDSFISSL